MPPSEDFAARLLEWYDRRGRHGLPWRQTRDPYRVWLSEIMLQQTRVTTVIPYYERFLARFPDIGALARAPVDDVLHHWTGLGYYARARNLHRAARIVVEDHGGTFPDTLEAVAALPGIGRSTAGAVLTLARGQRHPILDGNVKRVLARHAAIEGWPGQPAVARRLWALAEARLPQARVDDYTQAIMDLGATVCTRSRPDCPECPVRTDCAARAAGDATAYPQPRPRRALPLRRTRMLMIRDRHDRILLTRRPPAGIWGGLWSFPECAADADPASACLQHLGLTIAPESPWPVVAHGFTHYRLDIEPVPARLGPGAAIMEGDDLIWYNPDEPDTIGLPAPVRRLIDRLRSPT